MSSIIPWSWTVHAGASLLALSLTIGAYLLGRYIQRLTRSPLANPVLIAIVLIGLALHKLKMPYQDYFSGAWSLNFLLGPAVVALAIPLVRAAEQIRLNFRPVMGAILAGAVVSMISGYGLVRLLGGSRPLALSMLPKSLTTPLAIDVSRAIGGIPPLSAVLAIVSGVLVAISVRVIVRAVGVREPNALGLAAGTAGSGIAAARMIDEHPLSAAFSALAIGLNGLVTAVLAPFLARLLERW